MAINYNFFGCLFLLLITSCNSKHVITSKFNSNSNISTIYFTESGKKIDSLVFDSYYGKDSISLISENTWKYLYTYRCGTGCSSRKTALLSIYKNKLINTLFFESYYKEVILDDTSFKKNYTRKTEIIKNENQLFLKRICLKNDVEFYSVNEKLNYDLNKQIYYNKKFIYNGKEYNGVKIDSSEYIYYKNKWFEFDDKEHKLYQEM